MRVLMRCVDLMRKCNTVKEIMSRFVVNRNIQKRTMYRSRLTQTRLPPRIESCTRKMTQLQRSADKIWAI